MKTACTRSPVIFAAAAALVSVLAPVSVSADSIGSTYDMRRMLAEPHPLADQYGTRWQPPPATARRAPGRSLGIPAPILLPTPAAAWSPGPGTAPEPPPTTFAPPEPAPVSETAPPLPKSLPPQPAAKAAPAPLPPKLEMAPRLSIDSEGVEAEPEKKFEQPGPRPPLPPG